MRSKGRQGKLSLLLLFVGIFAFWWGISVLAQNGSITPTNSATTASAAQNLSGPVLLQVTAKNNVYTYAGSLPLSSSCEELGTGIAVNGINPVHVTVLITLRKPLTACAEAAGGTIEAPFSTSLLVKPGAKAVLDGLTVNGVIVAANVTEKK